MHSRMVSPIFLGISLIASSPGMAEAQPTVQAAWSQITGEIDPAMVSTLTAPGVELRFVTEPSADCGTFSVRYDTATAKDQLSVASPQLRAGNTLDIAVCTLPMGADWLRARLSHGAKPVKLVSKINRANYLKDGQFYEDAAHTKPAPWTPGAADGAMVSLPGPASIGSRAALTMVALGDTGCRGITDPADPSKRWNQNCTATEGRNSWPLPGLSKTAADLVGTDLDLVIHAGDYRYFFPRDYTVEWEYWAKEFFSAAQPLLLAAPWVFVRGNHEGCPGSEDPYGQGYFQLFGDKSGQSCADIGGANGYMQPWFFDVAAAGMKPHRFVVMDLNSYTKTPDTALMADRFRTAARMTAGGPASNWWVMHTPGVQAIYYGGKVHPADTNVRQALGEATGFHLCPDEVCRPSQFLLSHQHLFQSLTFAAADGDWEFPRMFIVGNGGVRIDSSSPAPQGDGHCTYDYDFPATAQSAAATREALVDSEMRHGLVIWTRDADTAEMPTGWTEQFLWAGENNLQSPRTRPAGNVPACK